MYTDIVQRLRVTYGVQGPLRYASVLDMGRMWERLLRRADLPLAYTQGFNPHPRLQFASALPVGYSSEAEILDVFLGATVSPPAFRRAIEAQAPTGLLIAAVEDVPLKAENPQALLHTARYRVWLQTPVERGALEAALVQLLARPEIKRRRMKKGQMAEYDLRPLIDALRYRASDGAGRHVVEMVLRCGPQGAGRPEEVIESLGLAIESYHIHRLRLLWGSGEEHST